MKLVRRIPASNTGNTIGWRVGPFSAWKCSRGTVDRYRNGIQVRTRSRRIAFIPTTRTRSLS